MGKRDRDRKERVIRGEEAGYKPQTGPDQSTVEPMSQAAAQFFLNVLKMK